MLQFFEPEEENNVDVLLLMNAVDLKDRLQIRTRMDLHCMLAQHVPPSDSYIDAEIDIGITTSTLNPSLTLVPFQSNSWLEPVRSKNSMRYPLFFNYEIGGHSQEFACDHGDKVSLDQLKRMKTYSEGVETASRKSPNKYLFETSLELCDVLVPPSVESMTPNLQKTNAKVSL